MNIYQFATTLKTKFETFFSGQNQSVEVKIFPDSIIASGSSLYCYISIESINQKMISSMDSFCRYKIILTLASKQSLNIFVSSYSDLIENLFDFIMSTFFTQETKISELFYDDQTSTSICTFEFEVGEQL